MGRAGIKRRKPRRPLPRLKRLRARVGDDGVPPHIMWPEPGSGFEASPWSPAGRAQAGWLFTRGLITRGGRTTRVARVVATVLLVFMLITLAWSWLSTIL